MRTKNKRILSLFIITVLMFTMVLPVYADKDENIKQVQENINKEDTSKEEVVEEDKEETVEKDKESADKEIDEEETVEKDKESVDKEIDEEETVEKDKESVDKEIDEEETVEKDKENIDKEIDEEENSKEDKEIIDNETNTEEEKSKEDNEVEAIKEEVNEEKIQIELNKEEIMAEKVPLKVEKFEPQSGSEHVNLNTEFSITFNKPVKAIDDPPEVLLYYDKTYNGKPTFEVDLSGALEVSKDNPNKMIIKINDKLEENHNYQLEVYCIEAEDGEGTFYWYDDYEGEWTFDTKPKNGIPKYLSIEDIPTRVNIKNTLELSARVADKVNKEIKDYKVNWETDNENIAIIEDGILKPQKLGVVTIKATAEGAPNVSDTRQIEIRENFSRQLVPVWNYPLYGDEYYGHPITTSDDSIYAAVGRSGDCSILALNYDGTKKENFNKTNVTTALSVGNINNKEYILAGNKNQLKAINPISGNVEWKINLNKDIVTTPVTNKNGNIIVGCGTTVYAINGESRRISWKYDTRDEIFRGNYLQPSIDKSGNIYIVSDKKLFCIDGISGSLLWEFKNPTNKLLTNQASIGKNAVYIQGENNIYSLNLNDGNLNWEKEFDEIGKLKGIVEDDGVYFSVIDNNHRKTIKLSCENGDLIDNKVYGVPTDFGININGGKLYTDKLIYDEDRKPIAYYDDYRNNLPYFWYSDFCLGRDNNIYRLLINEGKLVSLEAVTLYNTEGCEPEDIKIYGEKGMYMYNNSKHRLNAYAIDNNKVALPAIELEWISKTPDIASVDNGMIKTYNEIGKGVIEVKVKGTEIVKTIEFEVKERPIPTKISLVKYKKLNANIKDEQVINNKITGYVGQGLDRIRVFVEDKNGDFIPRQNIKWEIEDKEGILEALYDHGGSEDTSINYGVNITAKKIGTAKLRATLKVGDEELECKTEIEILPSPYNIKWSVLIDADWENKDSYHTMTEDKIFYVNQQRIFAINKKGEELWESRVGVDYGVQVQNPIVGKDGYIYLYSTDRTAVFKVDPNNGDVIWNIIKGHDLIKDLKTTKDKIYALTNEGKLYCINTDGKILWKKEFPNNGGILISKDEKVYIAQGNKINEINENEIKTIYTNKDGKLYLKDIDNKNNLIVQNNEQDKYSILSITNDGNANWEYKGEDDKGLNYEVKLSCDNQGRVVAVDYNEKEDKNVYIIGNDGKEQNITTINDKPTNEGVYKPIIKNDGYIYISIGGTHILDINDGNEKYKVEFKSGFNKICWPRTLTVDEDGIMYMSVGEKGIIAVAKKFVTEDKSFQIEVQGLKNIKIDTLKDIKIDITDTAEESEIKDIKVKMYLNEKNNENNTQLIYTTFKDKISKRQTKSYNCSIKIPKNGQYEMKVQIYKIENKNETLIHEFNKEIEL